MLFINSFAFSEDDNASFQLGNIGFGYYANRDNNFAIDFSALNCFFEVPGYFSNSKARLGIEYYPFYLRTLPAERNIQISFFNMNVFGDFLGPKDNWDYIRLGPFFSLHWLTIDNKNFDSQNYEFSTGLRFTLLLFTESILRIQFVDFELGHQIAQNENNFYLLIKFDILDFLIFTIKALTLFADV
jgi:hypothetical protein